MTNHFNLIRYPYVTEKSTAGIGKGQYQFVVPLSANKIEVKKSIEKLYKVKVLKVNMSRIPSKKKRVRTRIGSTAERKKAIVTLQKGDKIDLF